MVEDEGVRRRSARHAFARRSTAVVRVALPRPGEPVRLVAAGGDRRPGSTITDVLRDECARAAAAVDAAGRAERRPAGPAEEHDADRGLQVRDLGVRVDRKTLVADVSFRARPGTLTAVIGPSGAGKTTLVKLLSGIVGPTSGTVCFDGHCVHGNYPTMRSAIGLVPQEDVVHQQLTVEQALTFAAELRLPTTATLAQRRDAVARVLDELELTEHRHQRVDRLSGGQRKRASIAMELLTGPSLLILDEPTSGLDPALDRHVMGLLRRLADAGRVVVVVTHSLSNLSMCDQAVLLTPGGRTAFVGSPDRIGPTLGITDWADIFAWVTANPVGAHRAYRQRHAVPQPADPAPARTPPAPSRRRARRRQFHTLVRRQFRLIASDRGYAAYLVAMPFVLGALSLVVPGDVGLGRPDVGDTTPNEPNQILILLNIAAVFLGTALTIRDLVGERMIFHRERAVCLSASAYLAAKAAVYGVIVCVQMALVTAIVVVGRGGPTQGFVMLGQPVLELYLTLAVTAVASMLIGLVLSSLAKSNEQILPMLVVAIMVSIVFSGGMIPITGRVGFDQLSWLLPARWGFAASASVVDLNSIDALAPAVDLLWTHSAFWWGFDMASLLVVGAAAIVLLRWLLRLRCGIKVGRR